MTYKPYENLTLEEKLAEQQAFIADLERSLGRKHDANVVKHMLKEEWKTLRSIQEAIIARDAPTRRQGMSLVKSETLSG